MGKTGNRLLGNAKAAKNDEFYTQLADIQAEVNAYIDFDPDVFRGKTVLLPCDDPEWSNFTRFFAQNFERFGLKKLVSTSYALNSKRDKYGQMLLDYSGGSVDPAYGRIFVLDHDTNANGRIDFEDLEWSYLQGDGDFRSEEVRRLRDEADVVVTNPPFSLFREFLAWIVEADKRFLIIGNQNAITYKEVFPLIKENKMWLGKGFKGGATHFFSAYHDYATAGDHREGMIRVSGVVWFTNLDHGRRHQPLKLMTMAENIKFSKHAEIRGQDYRKYDNYDAIEVPFTDAIPGDYPGIMGVPISFLDKYCPEQFEILGATQRGCHDEVPDTRKYDDYWEVTQAGKATGSSGTKTNENANLLMNDGRKNFFTNREGRVIQSAYQRIFIRARSSESPKP